MGSRYATPWLAVAGLATLLAACDRTPANKDAPGPNAQAATPAATSGPVTTLSNKVERRTFRDWNVTCDNGATCAAIAPSFDDSEAWMTVKMAPEPTAIPEVLVGLVVAENVTASTKITLKINERVFRTERVGDPADAMARVVDADALNAVRAMATGELAVVSIDRDAIGVSLNGASASLLWIDERQGRLDTPNALVRVGQRVASVQAPALPVVTAAPAIAQGQLGEKDQILPRSIDNLPAVQECRGEGPGGEVFSARLGPQQELWGVPCGSGAYNFASALFLTGPNGQNPVALNLPQASGSPSNQVINGYYDPQTRTLNSFDKARGVGDCGNNQTWVWTGRSFALTLERSMEKCTGLPPDYWPTAWRAKVN